VILVLSGCHFPVHEDSATVFENIRSEFLRGNFVIAQEEVEKARKNLSKESTEWDIKFRLLEAEILTYRGLSSDVLALLSANATFPEVGDIAIKRKILCGLAYARLGRSQQSEFELREAQQLADVNDSSLKGDVLQAEGLIERHYSRYTKAYELFKRSLLFARRRGDKFLEATDLLNIGVVALETEHNDEALDWLKMSTEAARPIQARVILGTALGDIGTAYYNLGDFEKALSYFQQAEENAKELGNASAQANWLTNAGLSFNQLGDLAKAEDCYRDSLKIAQDIQDWRWIANSHTQLAFLLFQSEKFDTAKAYIDKALGEARLQGNVATEVDSLLLEALIAGRQSNEQEAERFLEKGYQKASGIPSHQWKIENALANLYSKRYQAKQAELWYRKSIHTFEIQRDSVKDEELKLPFFGNADTLYQDYAEYLIKARRTNEALQLLDIGRARTLEDGLGLSNAETGFSQKGVMNGLSIARKLDATILFYSLGPLKSYLWAVTPGRTRLFDLPKQADIESSVQKYQKAILKSSDPLGQENEGGRYLYNALVAPAASMIPKGSRVFIIPDGALNSLNFETLLAPDKTGAHYWIEDVTVTNANSIRLLSRFDPRTSTNSTKKLLLIGNPVSPSTQYEALPNAAVEVSSIQKHFLPDSRTVLTQAEAIPAAYTATKPDQFSYIHFVAHGTASRLSPLDSAVVLSPPAKSPDNFKLYARDIVHQPLHANLVTISACYGSGLRAYAGEGLVGLSWAFLRAGAHNVIGALWEANDASTPQLMDRMYSELDAGQRPDAALRAAKLSLIHSDSVYRKPLYWAAFQLYAGS